MALPHTRQILTVITYMSAMLARGCVFLKFALALPAVDGLSPRQFPALVLCVELVSFVQVDYRRSRFA